MPVNVHAHLCSNEWWMLVLQSLLAIESRAQGLIEVDMISAVKHIALLK